MDNLGGASFKVTADAASFMKAMSDVEQKAKATSLKIYTSVNEAAGAYELAGESYEVGARQVETALDRQVAAAVRATQAQKAMQTVLADTTVVQTRFAAAMDNASSHMSQVAGQAASASTAVGAAGNSSRMGALGFLYLSQAVEDAQYGFSAIVNNIPLIVMAMGGGPGLAGTISILSVATAIGTRHYEALANLFRSGAEQEAAARIEVLTEKVEKATRAFEELGKAKSESQKESGEALSKGIANAPGAPGGAEGFQKHLAEAMLHMGQAPQTFYGIAESIMLGIKASLSERFGGDSVDEVIKRDVQRKKTDALGGQAQALIGAAAGGDEAARSKIAAIMKRNPGAFTEAERKAFEESSPEAIKAQEQKRLELEGVRNNRKMEEKLAQEELNEKQQQAVWEAQGRKNDRAMVKKLQENEKRDRIQALQDQREGVVETRDNRLERLRTEREEMGHTQILQGAKSVTDMFQRAAGDSVLIAINREIKDIQVKAKARLDEIADQLKKERGTNPRG